MPQGLAAFLLPLGPAMWHEFALGLDFADPRATIDLLIAADAVTARPDCDRATAALILAKAVTTGFHRGQCPPAFDGRAARAFANRLSDAMVTGAYPTARFALDPQSLRLVIRALGTRGPLRLPPLSLGVQPHHPPCAFAGWRPVGFSTPLARAS